MSGIEQQIAEQNRKAAGFFENYASEHALCVAFVKQLEQTLAARHLLYPDSFFWHHNPNELPRIANKSKDPRIEKAYAIMGGKLNAIGRKKGLPDYFFTWKDPRGFMAYGYLEAKMKGNPLTPEQKEFRARCERNGIPFGVFHTVNEGLNHLITWGAIRP